MQVGQFPASAANSLIEGYCDDFVSLAAILAQTLEQVSMRGIGFDASRPSLQRIEKGMRELADGIQEMLNRGSLTQKFENVLPQNKDRVATPPEPAPAPAPSPMAQGPLPPRNAPARVAPNTNAQPSRPAPTPAPAAPAPSPRPAAGEPLRARSGPTAPSSTAPAPQTRTAPPAQPTPTPAQPGPTPAPQRNATQPTQPLAPAQATPTASTASGVAPRATQPPASTPSQRPPGAGPATAPPPATPAPSRGAAAPQPPQPTRRAGKPEGLCGTARSMPLVSVFQFLGRTRKSGTLHVNLGEEIVAFEFVNGCIEFTASNQCPVNERLGELLVELGFCTRDRLAPVLAKVGVSSAHRLGHLVVEERIVSNGQVLEALEAQVLHRYHRVCQFPEAVYEFDPGPRAPGDGRIRIAPFELTMGHPWQPPPE